MSQYDDTLTAAFQDELIKIAQIRLASATQTTGIKPSHKFLGAAVAGGLAYESLRRANQDRRMGRTMRLQQQGF